MVDVSVNPPVGFMRVVAQRDAATLLPIINQHVLPGTEIHSDEWRAYRQVDQLPNVARHQTVNHTIEFVSPTGVHTQNIESYWNRVKIKLKRMRGCHAHVLDSYLDEFMYRERWGRTATECFNTIITDIAAQYPV
jgi:transposase-like protein